MSEAKVGCGCKLLGGNRKPCPHKGYSNPHLPKGYAEKIGGGPTSIEFANGSKIVFRSSGKASPLKGISWDRSRRLIEELN